MSYLPEHTALEYKVSVSLIASQRDVYAAPPLAASRETTVARGIAVEEHACALDCEVLENNVAGDGCVVGIGGRRACGRFSPVVSTRRCERRERRYGRRDQ